MCISAWRLIFGICVHLSLPPSAWTYLLAVNLSLSLALGVNGQKMLSVNNWVGVKFMIILLDKTLWNWAKNKNTLGKITWTEYLPGCNRGSREGEY